MLLRAFLSRHIPLIVSVYAAVLRDQRQRVPSRGGHSILLCGFDGDRVFYLDPTASEERWVGIEHLLFAMYARPLSDMTAYMVAANAPRTRPSATRA